MRKKAIWWWHTLSPLEQQGYFLEYQEINFTPATSLSQLTGREIEKIWKTVVNEEN